MHEDAMTRLRLALKLEVSLVARHARLRMSAVALGKIDGSGTFRGSDKSLESSSAKRVTEVR